MSNIDPNKINKGFPVAGRDNDSSVFRNNFTGIFDNFTLAKTEIDNLQTYGIFKTTLPDQPTVDNDMGGTAIKNPTLSGVRETIKYHYTVAGPAYINFNDATVHLMEITANSSLVFQNWPDKTYAKVRVIFNMIFQRSITIAKPVSGEIYGFTKLPNAVYDSVNQTYTITFNDTGYHIFDFSTVDAGKNIFVEDVTRNRAVVESDLTVAGDILPQGNVLYNLGSTTQAFNHVHSLNANVGTLVLTQATPASANAAGTIGQISVDSNYVYVCVANNTWKRANLSTW